MKLSKFTLSDGDEVFEGYFLDSLEFMKVNV